MGLEQRAQERQVPEGEKEDDVARACAIRTLGLKIIGHLSSSMS